MRIDAPAKINLFLSVGPRRPDGNHEIQTIFQSVSLLDTLTLSALPSGLTLDVEPAGSAPEDESNLVVRAVRALWAATGRTPGVAITLTKAIPAAAGMGGGSADAAGALVALNTLWDAGLSRKALEKIGSAIGADVPFCVRGGTAAGRGRGEVLSPLPVRSPLWWVIAVPDLSLSTAAVYEAFDRITVTPALEDPFDIVDALARGDLAAIAGSLRNDLEAPALSLAPSMGSARQTLVSAGALAAVMSGSGPAWVALCRDREHADEVAQAVRSAFAFVAVVSSLEHGPRIASQE